MVTIDPLAQALAIVLATFASEDLASVGTGLLIAARRIDPALGVVSCALGIWLGDLGLWLAGRLAGPALDRPWMRRRISRAAIDSAAGQVRRHAGVVLITSRFVPGSRVVTYVAAGALGVPLTRFAAWTALAVSIWAPAIVFATAAGGETAAAWLRGYAEAWWIALAIVAIAVWKGRPIGRAAAYHARRLARWEFWPAWLFYAPVVPWVGWLLVTRGPRALAAANPGLPDGGFVGESKSAMLDALPPEWTLPGALVPPGAPAERLRALRTIMADAGWTFPVILKPDVGQRGTSVRLVTNADAAGAYLTAHAPAVIAQVFHPGPYEAGIFYYRFPGDARGRIFSVTDKRFPVLTGDGRSTIEALIQAHPRYRLQAGLFLTRHAGQRTRVPAAGEAVLLARSGNHAQGTMFLDGWDLVTDALVDRVDAIARQIDGFFIGRFDVRYRDVARFMRGEDLAIVELNGVSAEATHIYAPGSSLLDAYRTLFRQWSLVFAIGAENVRLGRQSASLSRLIRLSLAHLTTRRPALVAD
jgi:membrane protein DedA with SNARE-associated domain